MPGPLTMIDLFAGCGGMTAGFVTHGFNPVLSVEWNLHAAATYAANFGEDHTVWGDIAQVPDSMIPEADVVIGGPPCQGFSNLGSRDVNDPRNKLWKQYIRVVQYARPQVFVIENVDRFMRSAEFQLLLNEADRGMLREYELSYG
ncbi:MAG: DNA (cytosine-5-)-methyltransferase, partial [Acidobacteria bacterium]|nr:DNA (cytosine-5-)-methyltransferase [Acidobacteriota bacterium]